MSYELKLRIKNLKIKNQEEEKEVNKKDKFIVIAGPCVVESYEVMSEVASILKQLASEFPEIYLIFKSSYNKANRTSLSSFTGLETEEAMSLLETIRQEFQLPVLTDIHTPEEASKAARYVDILQIPAFLSRQTDLLVAAGKTGLPVNIKKGQFMAPEDMFHAIEKVQSGGSYAIWLTERGTCFGYHDLVVDFRSLVQMKKYGCPVIFDATHSVQKPSIGTQSGGAPEFILPLAKAATAVRIDGIFFETHPNPEKALSDSKSQLNLSQSRRFLYEILEIRHAALKLQEK